MSKNQNIRKIYIFLTKENIILSGEIRKIYYVKQTEPNIALDFGGTILVNNLEP